MRIVIRIALLFFPLAAFGQEEKYIDTVFVNTSLGNLFQGDTAADSVTFSFDSYQPRFIKIFAERKIPGLYNLDFLGDQYLLQKRWGAVSLPEIEIAALMLRLCNGYSRLRFEGRANAGLIAIRMSYECPDDTIDRIFGEVENEVRYKEGKKKLHRLLEDAVFDHRSLLKNIPGDSTLLFQVLLTRKDSCISKIKLTGGEYSAFAQIIMGELKKSGPWLPAIQSGRPVNSYFRIFVRLTAQNKIIADYSG